MKKIPKFCLIIDAAWLPRFLPLGRNRAMTRSFSQAISAGRTAYQSTPILPREMASPSTPVVGTPFWVD